MGGKGWAAFAPMGGGGKWKGEEMERWREGGRGLLASGIGGTGFRLKESVGLIMVNGNGMG